MITIAPKPPQQFTRLGPATGSFCGSLGFLGTATYFFPAGINGRMEEAYARALANIPGATGLIDVTVQEGWSWWILGTARCVTVTGEAIK